MTNQDHLGDLAAAYALNALTPVERHAATAHLLVCTQCREEVRDYRRTIDVLPLAAPVNDPSDDLKPRLLDAAHEEASVLDILRAGLQQSERTPQPMQRTYEWAALAAAAAIVIALAGWYGARKTAEVARMRGEMIVAQTQLAAREHQTSAEHAIMVAVANGKYWKLPSIGENWRCSVFQAPSENSATLVGTFPRAPRGMVWRLWVIQKAGVHGGWMVHPGAGVMRIPMPVRSGDEVAVTMEQANGSGSKPSGPFMMRTTLD